MTNIEEPKDPFGLNVSTCDGYTASCCEPKQKQEAPQKNLDPSKLGGSGIASKRRSTVTKSILRSGQGGFDDHGDPCKGVSSIVKISSARPSMVASLVSTIVGENKAEEVKKFLFIPITNNVKALFVMMVLFASISIAQYFAAVAAHSLSLKADVMSMAVDAGTYLGNIIGESSEVPARRIVLQLIFSFISLAVLLVVNTNVLREAIATVREYDGSSGDDGEGDGVNANYVFAFALAGLLFDAACLYAFYYYASKDAEIEYQEILEQATIEGRDMEDAKKTIKKPQVNMLSALLHVSADLMRSTTTFIEGILLYSASSFTPEKQSFVDAICGLIICAIIYAGALYAIYEWVVSFYHWFMSLGEAIEVECPECDKMVIVEPQKAGHGRVADVVLG